MGNMNSNYKKTRGNAPRMGEDGPRNSMSGRTPLSSTGIGGKKRTMAGKGSAAKSKGLRGVKGGSGAKGAGKAVAFKNTSGRGGAVKGPY
jgi:hypothetical protein